jgi:hypothetical protein
MAQDGCTKLFASNIACVANTFCLYSEDGLVISPRWYMSRRNWAKMRPLLTKMVEEQAEIAEDSANMGQARLSRAEYQLQNHLQ